MHLAVDQHGADAAGALAAAELRRGIADAVAQRGEQARAAVDEHRDGAAVVLGLDRRFHGVPLSRRLRCTAICSRRYQALASASVGGLVPSAAAATAAAMPLSSSTRPSSARSTDLARIGAGA